MDGNVFRFAEKSISGVLGGTGKVGLRSFAPCPDLMLRKAGKTAALQNFHQDLSNLVDMDVICYF